MQEGWKDHPPDALTNRDLALLAAGAVFVALVVGGAVLKLLFG